MWFEGSVQSVSECQWSFFFFFSEMEKLILKLIWKWKGHQIAKIAWIKKEQIWGFKYLTFKTSYKAMLRDLRKKAWRTRTDGRCQQRDRNSKKESERKTTGVPWWLSRLRIWCHCCGSGHCCGVGSVSSPENFHMPWAQPKGEKTNSYKNKKWQWGVFLMHKEKMKTIINVRESTQHR